MMHLQVANMNCGGCAKGVAATIRDAAPLARTEFTLDRHEVAVSDADDATVAILEALRLAGWDASLLSGAMPS